jgi:hypothetical protein
MNKMKPHIKAKWLEALRSGEYKQGRDCLHNTSDDTFCCLGVLTDLYQKEQTKNKKKKLKESVDSDAYTTHTVYTEVFEQNGSVIRKSENGVLLRSVAMWAGLNDQNPDIVVNGSYRTVAELNDEGKSFKEIADLIEKNL